MTGAAPGPAPRRRWLAVLAAAAATVGPLALPAAAQAERFTFSGDRMETVLAEGRERTLLSGAAELISDDTHIRAERIELFGEDFEFALSSGAVKVINIRQGIELTSDSLFYNRREKVARTQGNAVLVDRENEIVAKGGHLEDWEEREETIIQIGVRIFSEDLVSRAEFARYNRRDNTLELSGLPVVTWKGDEYRASRIFIDLDADTIRLEGTVRGQITTESEPEEPSDRPAAGAEPAPAADAAEPEAANPSSAPPPGIVAEEPPRG